MGDKVAQLMIVIPTRNRPELAQRAITSVLQSDVSGVRVLVSDNSTDETGRADLARFCRGSNDERLSYVAPAAPCGMTEHWNWALGEAQRDTSRTHFAFLTDRMVFRDGALAGLSLLLENHGERVVTYKNDILDDRARPVQLMQSEWSGELVELNALALLQLASRGVFPTCLPRMLNCVVPGTVLNRMRRRFGTVFSSVSPDFCFCFRALEVLESVAYYDKSLLISYGLDRSNGANYERGLTSQDSADFVQQLGALHMNYAAPLPSIPTGGNAMLNEYCAVQAETGSAKFPRVRRRPYLTMLAWDIGHLADPAVRAHAEARLAEEGVGKLRRRLLALWRLRYALVYLRHPSGFLRRLLWREAIRSPQSPLWSALRIVGVRPPIWLRLGSVDEGLSFAVSRSGPRTASPTALVSLIGRGSARTLEHVVKSAGDRESANSA